MSGSRLSTFLALTAGALLLCCSYFFYHATGLAALAAVHPAAEPSHIATEESAPVEERQEEEKQPGQAESGKNEDTAISPEPCKAVILAVGDIMVHQTQFVQAYDVKSKSYDFSPSFEYITPYLQASNLTAGNLETTLAGAKRGFSAFPHFNSPDELAPALKEAGFELLCTANNHSLDSGEAGVYRTLEVVEEAGLKAFGTARTQEERDTPLLVETNGMTLAFLAYTYGTNGIPLPPGREYIVNLIDRELMHAQIQKARQAGAELIVVYMHWGWEYRSDPSPEQKDLARFLAAAGADIIIGSHPHVIQPMEYISVEDEEGEEHRAFVAYSLGNFISNQHRIPGSIPTHEVQYGMLLRLRLQRDAPGKTPYLEDVDYRLTWVDRARRHRIVPLPPVTPEQPAPAVIPEGKWPQIRETALNLQERLAPFSPGKFDLIEKEPLPLPVP